MVAPVPFLGRMLLAGQGQSRCGVGDRLVSGLGIEHNCQVIDIVVDRLGEGVAGDVVAPNGGEDLVVAGSEAGEFETAIAANHDGLAVEAFGGIDGNPHSVGDGRAVAEINLAANVVAGLDLDIADVDFFQVERGGAFQGWGRA